MSSLAALWERIEAWYAAQDASELLNPGADEAEIAAAEKELGLSFPPDLRESLLRHDGSADGGWPRGELLSLERIAQERSVWMELLQDGTFDPNSDHNADSDALQAGWWHAGWIPLDTDGGGNSAVVDTAPGPDGQAGQIVDMDHEAGPSGPDYVSLQEYLAAVADELETGEYVVSDDMVMARDEADE